MLCDEQNVTERHGETRTPFSKACHFPWGLRGAGVNTGVNGSFVNSVNVDRNKPERELPHAREPAEHREQGGVHSRGDSPELDPGAGTESI